MNGKQRVAAAVSRRNADRPALSCEATYEVTEALIRRLRIDRAVGSGDCRSWSTCRTAGCAAHGEACSGSSPIPCPDTFVWLNMNGCFDFARFMRGTEQFLVDMACAPEMAEVLLDKVNHLAIAFFERCFAAAGDSFHGVYLGDDFGTQHGLLMSPAMWRKHFRPRYEKLLSVIRASGTSPRSSAARSASTEGSTNNGPFREAP